MRQNLKTIPRPFNEIRNNQKFNFTKFNLNTEF